MVEMSMGLAPSRPIGIGPVAGGSGIENFDQVVEASGTLDVGKATGRRCGDEGATAEEAILGTTLSPAKYWTI